MKNQGGKEVAVTNTENAEKPLTSDKRGIQGGDYRLNA